MRMRVLIDVPTVYKRWQITKWNITISKMRISAGKNTEKQVAVFLIKKIKKQRKNLTFSRQVVAEQL